MSIRDQTAADPGQSEQLTENFHMTLGGFGNPY